MTFGEWYAPWRHPGMTEDELSAMDRCRAAWDAAVAAQREKDAQVAEADLNPCPVCGLGGTPDHRARGIAAVIREGTE